VDLAGLGVHQVCLDPVTIATEQGVGQRAVAPEDPGTMEIDQERRHRIQQSVPIRTRSQREAHEQAAILDGIDEVLRRQDRRVPIPGFRERYRPHSRQTRHFEPPQDLEFGCGYQARLLLQRVRVTVKDEEPDKVT
jgi:hypothetical protein